MKTRLLCPSLFSAIVLVASLAQSQETPPVKLERKGDELSNQFGWSLRMGYNLNVSFKNLGGFAAKTDPGPSTGGRTNRYYDDGYNLVDVSGNQNDQTWYWGYDDKPGQWDPANPNVIVMHSFSSPAGVNSLGRSDDPQLGFELTYNGELFRNETWRWGVEAALGYANLSVSDSRAFSAEVNRINDAFDWPHEVRPTPGGYEGLFDGSQGSGFLLGSSPTRTTTVIPGGASITGTRRFDADLFSFRLGPYLQVPIGEKWALSLSGGLVLVQVNSDFSFNETVTISGVGSVNTVGSGSHGDLRMGYYAAGSVAYKLSQAWGLFSGLQYQDAGTYSHTVAGRQAVLDLGQSVFLTGGLSYSF